MLLNSGYQEAVQQVENLMSQIEVIREKWDDWAETQQSMKEIMLSIEKELTELRKGGNNSQVSLTVFPRNWYCHSTVECLRVSHSANVAKVFVMEFFGMNFYGLGKRFL